MMSAAEVKEWLSRIPDTAMVAINDDGMALVEVCECRDDCGHAYIEIGAEPEC